MDTVMGDGEWRHTCVGALPVQAQVRSEVNDKCLLFIIFHNVLFPLDGVRH